MKINDRYRHKHTKKIRRIMLIERVPLTKHTSVEVVQLDGKHKGRWGVTPLLAYWKPI